MAFAFPLRRAVSDKSLYNIPLKKVDEVVAQAALAGLGKTTPDNCLSARKMNGGHYSPPPAGFWQLPTTRASSAHSITMGW